MIILGKNEYSEKEIKAAKELWNDGPCYLARNKDGHLFAYYGPIYKSLTTWQFDHDNDHPKDSKITHLSDELFENVCWKDKKPVYVGDVLRCLLPLDENRYIREVIKLFNREDIKGIFKAYTNGQLCLTIYGERPFPYAIISIEDNQFETMTMDYGYTLEELGV